MIKTITIETGMSEMSPLEAHKISAIDAKVNHLSIQLLHDYVLNKEALTIADVSKVEEHIINCDSCKFQIDTFQKDEHKP
ncbi:hypothetical protein [Mucilaginibacter ginsenosidivorax]|uniref:Uncharacterized protein n=1 Tax=Mucilaginibacter ginsenosidivorax TaxID=862126 RepID=A0A5B8W8W9_9SPHI|nr:hypothetical protein [Mucilaginibacter ginsenosidivorax]QEC79342.1 hypothetical protein FSB76_26585 [Mucilaginibacter ginsenosidivorax]